MPYCPKCDMEFIDGITQCSDCGGALVESKKVADAMLQKQRREEAEEIAGHYFAEEGDFADEENPADEILPPDDDAVSSLYPGKTVRKKMTPVGIYVKKSQQYDDYQSSATAFLLIGSVLVVFSLLCWLNVIKLPMAGAGGVISRLTTTVLGLAALYVAYTSSVSAKKVQGEIEAEETVTKQLVDWFIENYHGSKLDEQIHTQLGELAPEELALKRFELIQDIIITSHDIADQAYVDLLAEEIYGKLYED